MQLKLIFHDRLSNVADIGMTQTEVSRLLAARLFRDVGLKALYPGAPVLEFMVCI